MARLDGQIHARRQPGRCQLRLCLLGVVPDAADARQVRRHAHAPERHEAGSELPEAARADVAAGHHRQHQPDRLLSDPGGPAAALQGRDLGPVRRGHGGRRQLDCDTVVGRPPKGGLLFWPIPEETRAIPTTGHSNRPFTAGRCPMDTTRRGFVGGASALALFSGSSAAFAQKKYDDGASDTEIKIGNTNPYSGPASSYAAIAKTIDAYFKSVNDAGGINGRKIKFISLDDGYSPPQTVEMVRQLVEQDKIFALFQSLGTPCNTAIHKYMNQKKVPQLYVATGASKWGDPKNFPWTMGFQPDYHTEAVIYAKHILANVKDAKIGVLMQNDDYGKEYYEGFKEGLGKETGRVVKVVTFEATDPTVDSQIIQLKDSGANVFFNVSGPKAAAQGIRKAADINWKPAHSLNKV